MKNTQKVLLIGLIYLWIVGCQKGDSNGSENESVQFFWNQSKCADPWNTGENDSHEETKKVLTAYLEAKNISVQKLDFETDSYPDVSCESCNCSTGQIIKVEVTDSDISNMEELGFYR
ncbi:hypothetical protein [Flagellimonas marina]|uniref:Uncharacterized protein n=1 Tax=Flagellimonas marina TaxID=1775168 RepID=A0ABV8PM46_9FLAO